MNPELAAILGRDLNPAPGSEPAPMALVARLNPAFALNTKRQKRAMWAGAARDRPKPATKPKRQAKPRPPSKPRYRSSVSSMTRDELLAAYEQHGSWRRVARHHDCCLTTVTDRAIAVGATVRPRKERAPPLTRELLAAAHAEHGSWHAVAKALHRREKTISDAARAAGLRFKQRKSDAELLAAYDQGGSLGAAVRLLGLQRNGAIYARLRQLLEVRR